MRTDTLYPYWEMIHLELLDEVSMFTPEQIEAAPNAGSQSLRQIVVGFAAQERFQIAHLVGGNRYDRPATSEYVTSADLLDLLKTTRQITDRVLEPISKTSLASVRTLPANLELNRHATNVPVAWLIWDVLHQEITCLGRIRQRFEDQGWLRLRRRP